MASRRSTTSASSQPRMTFGSCVILLMLLCMAITVSWITVLPVSPAEPSLYFSILRNMKDKSPIKSKSKDEAGAPLTPPELLAETISHLIESVRKERASVLSSVNSTGQSHGERLKEMQFSIETQKTLLKQLENGNNEITKELQSLKAAVGRLENGSKQEVEKIEKTQQQLKHFADQIQRQLKTSISPSLTNEQSSADTTDLEGGSHGSRIWRQRAFIRYNDPGYVKFSGYRLDNRSFVAVGLAVLILHDTRTFGACRWEGRNGVVSGKLRAVWPREHHDLMYEALNLICEMDEVAPIGGVLHYTIDQDDIVTYRESNSSKQLLDPPEDFPLFATVCTAPMHGREFATFHIREFVEYYKLLGVGKFILYDAGTASSEFWRIFEPDLKRGVMEVTDFRVAQYFQSWYYGQLLAIQDCIYRERFSSRWVLMADMDEYLWVQFPHSLTTYLSMYHNKAGISHGAWWFSTALCRPWEDHVKEFGPEILTETANSMFTCERFVFRWPQPACFEEGENIDAQNCLTDKGHRKLIVNPRKVERLSVHNGVYGDEEGTPPDFFNARPDSIGHAHFQHLTGGTGGEAAICNSSTPLSKGVNWWKLDLEFSKHVQRLREDFECDLRTYGCKKAPAIYT